MSKKNKFGLLLIMLNIGAFLVNRINQTNGWDDLLFFISFIIVILLFLISLIIGMCLFFKE